MKVKKENFYFIFSLFFLTLLFSGFYALLFQYEEAHFSFKLLFMALSIPSILSLPISLIVSIFITFLLQEINLKDVLLLSLKNIPSLLFKKNPQKNLSIITHTISVIFTLLIVLLISYFVSFKLITSIRKPQNLTLVILIVNFFIFICGLLIYKGILNAFKPLFISMKKYLFFKDRLIYFVKLILSVFIIVFLFLYFKNKTFIESIDFIYSYVIISSFFTSLLLLAITWKKSRIFFHCLVVISIFLILFPFFYGNFSENERNIFSSRLKLVKEFYMINKKFFDFDKDGYLSFYGEGDCAPFNPRIFPGQIDIPNNKIDEDCWSGDLVLNGSADIARWDYPVPLEMQKRFNIILLTIDAMNPSHLGFFGYKRPITNNIDKFAHSSIAFKNAFSQGPSTRLSFPSFFISKYDSQIKYENSPWIPHELKEDNLLLAEILKENGYKTAAITPLDYFANWKGIFQGFDDVITSPIKEKSKHNSDKVTDAAILFLKNNIKDLKPFFLWAHYYDPHGPFEQPDTIEKFGKEPVDRYDAEIKYTDIHIGRLLNWIDKNLDPNDTIIIITADHGESFDITHKHAHHGYDLHSEVLHVPLFIKCSFCKPKIISHPVSLIDVTPTIINILQIKGKFEFEGDSLVPLLLGEKKKKASFKFHQFYLPENVYHKKPALRMISVRFERYNLIWNITNNVFSLYDYYNDPYEANNIYTKLPEISSKLRNELQKWRFRIEKNKK